jgi:hypothetical protein
MATALEDTSAVVKKYQSPSFMRDVEKKESGYDILTCKMVNSELRDSVLKKPSLRGRDIYRTL